MHAQYPLPPAPQQKKAVNLLQLHALHWLYTHSQQNIPNRRAHCCQGAGQQPFNNAQPNMNYFVPPQNVLGQQPFNLFNPQGGGGGVKQLYNHTQSAMQNLPPMRQPLNTSFVPPQCIWVQQPYPYNNMLHIQQAHGQSHPQNMTCMPQPYFNVPQGMNFVPHPCGQSYQPDKPALVPLRSESNVKNLPGYNVPLASCQSKAGQPTKKHLYVNGALYNIELLEPALDKLRAGDPEYAAHQFIQDLDFADEDIEDDGYDPLDDTLPSVYGIRFYNPNNGPEGAIPKRFAKKNAEPSEKPPESIVPNIPHYQSTYSLFPLHRVDNLGSNLIANKAVAHKSQNQQNVGQELADAAYTATHNYIASMSPNSKTKRRQGRSRPRGFTQSFGIVAPIKRNNQIPKENVMAAKNVLSLFDKKPQIKKWDDMDEKKTDINIDSNK